MISSCRNGSDTMDGKLAQVKESIKKGESIKINTTKTVGRYRHAKFYQEDGNNYMIGYDNRANQFNIHDLDSGNLYNTISLDNIGPNQVGELRSFAIRSMTEFFILSDKHISVVNKDGEVIQSIRINTADSPFIGLEHV